MAGSILGMNNYASFFSSPVNSYSNNPLTNLISGSYSSKFYAQTVAKKLQSNVSSYLTSMSKNAFDIKSASKSLATSGTNSSFKKKAVSSTDSNAIIGNAAYNADKNSFTVNISKLATAQSNFGKALKSDDKSNFSIGQHTMKVKIGNTEKNISFSINDTDTNKSGLEKMAWTINSSKVGISANVITDSKTGTSSIKLSADKTGTESAFTIEDTTGNAALTSGANTITSEAQNAEYSIDGKQYTSESNTISVNNNKVQLTLKKAEGKDIKLTVSSDTKALQSDIEKFISSYNQMVQFANTNSTNFYGAQKIKSELTDILSSKKASLVGIGIQQNDDGTLVVDGKKLEGAIINNSSAVKDVFGGPSGIANKMTAKATTITSSPLKYTQLQDASNPYSLLSNSSSTSNTASYQQNLYVGLVVDTLL